MNADILKAVQIINQRIENLEKIKAMLLEEYGAESTFPKSTVRTAQTTLLTLQNANGNGHGTRRDQLVRFLTEHGPAKRATIIARSGMPKGSIAFLLNQKDYFARTSDGMWTARIRNSAQEITH